MDFYAIGIELLKGIGLFFLHPLFYILVLFSLFLGYKRVQKERRDFHTRVYDVIDDLITPLVPGLLAGLLLSIAIVSLGIVLPVGVIVLFSLVYVVILLTGQARWLSVAYTGSLTLLVALVLPKIETGTALIDKWIAEINAVHLGGLAILIGLLIFIEGMLILKNSSKHSSPILLKSKRGKTIGAHELRKIWILPVLFLLPSGVIPISDLWPVISTQSTHVGFIMVPFGIGFQQVVRSTLPVYAIINYGKRVLLVGIGVLGLAILSLYVPIFIPFAAVMALLGRELIEIAQKLHEENEINMYTQRENGLVILGVIPKSPASKMNAKVGEVIIKVNSVKVKTNQQFYEALQLNSAFCKLEIIDENGEIRFGQTALYDGKHHQVGLLFVHQDKNNLEGVI